MWSHHDVVQPRHTTPTSPNGPMTRARVKALRDKVNSLLSMCDLDTPLNGLLLHSDTLCILRNHLDDDPQWSEEDDREKTQEDGQESSQEGEDEDQTASGGTTGSPEPVLPPSPDVAPVEATTGSGTTSRARLGTTATCRRGTTAPTTAPTTVSPGSSWCPRVPSR